MNMVYIYRLIFLCFLIIDYTNGCSKKKYIPHAITIIGDELNLYSNTDSYTECDVDFDLLLTNFYRPELKTYHHFGDINLAISIPKNHVLKDDIIRLKIYEIFSNAENHLRAEFVGETYDFKTYRKILICCIEYSIRLKNTKYIENPLIINCKRILGLEDEKLDFHYQAELYTDKSIFEFVIVT